MNFHPCAIVPSYNHHTAVEQVIEQLRAQGLPVLIIDDGSDCPTKEALAKFHDPKNNVQVHRLDVNQGKGGAVSHGLKLAYQLGYTHGVQLDADGQHETEALPTLLRLAHEHPECLISGKPVYDDTVPKSRLIGRYLTHVWVWIETLSFQISDSMCGYRVYPLEACQKLLGQKSIGQRMDFDIEVMVRLFWQGVPVIMTPVRVNYPENNISNFHVIRDNWQITKMHTRLVVTMVLNLPKILRNRPRKVTSNTHWARIDERGMAWGLSTMAFIYRLLGPKVCFYAMQPVLVYFFLTGAKQRAASMDYLDRVGKVVTPRIKANWWQSFRHFRSFCHMAVDKFSAWMGDITIADLVIVNELEMEAVIASRKGVVVFASHLGNIEICRALSLKRSGVRITVLTHTKHAVHFNQLLSKYSPDAIVDMVQVSELGPATAIELQDRLTKGEWIVIAGDRTPVSDTKRVSEIDFLGKSAQFGQGSVILAALLKAPVYMMLCMKVGPKYHVIFEKLADRITLPRKKRTDAITSYLSVYVAFLERFCKKYPYQWFNFFNFWSTEK